ncbi:hypothetical protein COB55_03770 [Candidatus Wolfebacteria bacterium]|nr:MAG: hypothetical protein COB55_03770 [Candidatus Wolfebacteria bacterium]
MKEIKWDFDGISIVPSVISDIDSRSAVNVYNKDGKLPIYVSPMDTIISEENHKQFLDLGYNLCLPRGDRYSEKECFVSYGLSEISEIVSKQEQLPPKVLIDIANGNMLKLHLITKIIVQDYDVELMVGNIANPETYRMLSVIGVDYVRCGIGGGSVCTTSANVAIFYPMGSLIKECYDISCTLVNPPKIIADGGFKNYDEIIKALALGADGVMLGSIFNKCIESCGKTYKRPNGYCEVDRRESFKQFEEGSDVYKLYRGMSTKSVQKSWGNNKLKTGEGITKYNKVEYTLDGWTENFVDYLKSNMSYCGKRELEEYIGEVEYVHISENSLKRFKK